MLTSEHWVPAFFQALDAKNIRYAVLRNYESLPQETGNDLDVLVDPDCRSDARTVLFECVQRLGGVIHHIADFSCTSVFFHDPESMKSFHVDLFDRITWRCFDLLLPRQALGRTRSYNGISVIAEEDEALLNLFNHLLHGGGIREKYQAQINEQSNRQEMEVLLKTLLGRSLAMRTIRLIRDNKWRSIEALRRRFRLSISFRRSFLSPWRSGRAFISDLIRFIKRVLGSPGLFIVMVGPDGSGKSTAGLALKERLQGTFYSSRIRYFHWKARLIKQDTVPTGPPKSDPHGASLRSMPQSLLFFLAHALEGIIGHWLKVKPVLFKNGLVMVDRYYYDYFVDPRRFRLQLPVWLVRLVYRFVPKPDLIFFYDASTEILQSRKQEVPFEECDRQREAYLKLATRLPQAIVIDAEQSAAQVAEDVHRKVFQWMEKRSARRG
jgi:thymidylate kinase